MNTILSSLLWSAALLPAVPPDGAARPDAQPLVGKYLVLPNGSALEGDIERVGDQYRVRRPVGETWVSLDKAARLCANGEEVYIFLRGRVRNEDLDGRLRLAEWCRDHDLRIHALAEVESVLETRPNYPPARFLLNGLRQGTSSVTAVTPPAPLPTAPPPPNVELTAEVLNHFAQRVQPILMNTCANCHNEARGTTFRLVRVSDTGLASRRTLQLNVAAVLSYVNPAQPMNSQFLTKAVNVHWPTSGAADPSLAPFRNRQAPAFRALEDWVRLAVDTSGSTLETIALAPTNPKPAPEVRTPPIVPVKVETTAPITIPRRIDLPMSTPEVPTTAPTGPDVYSPDDFNRRNHPDRVKPPER